MKFWLQVVLGALFTKPVLLVRISGSGSGKTGFSGNFFFAFFASMDLFGLQGHPRMFRYHLIRIRIWIREIRFFEIRTFCFFDFLSLKTLQYGCLMTPLDYLMDPWWSRTHPDIRIRIYLYNDYCFQREDFWTFLLYIMLLNFPLLKLWGPESIHNTYDVPSEPERAAKARRAVVASTVY